MGLVSDEPAATPAPETANSSAHGGSTSFKRLLLLLLAAWWWCGSAALASMAELMVGVVLPLLLRSELAVVSLGEKPQQNQSRFCLRSTNSKPTLLSAVRVDAAGARTGRTQSGQSNARSAAAAKVGLRFGVGSAGQEVRCRGVSLERLWGGRNSSDLLLVQLF